MSLPRAWQIFEYPDDIAVGDCDLLVCGRRDAHLSEHGASVNALDDPWRSCAHFLGGIEKGCGAATGQSVPERRRHYGRLGKMHPACFCKANLSRYTSHDTCDVQDIIVTSP